MPEVRDRDGKSLINPEYQMVFEASKQRPEPQDSSRIAWASAAILLVLGMIAFSFLR